MTQNRRSLPYAEDAERSVLGACLLDERAIDQARKIVGAPDFYLETIGRWYATAVEMRDAGEPVEPITLARKLDLDSRGKAKIAQIMAETTSSSNVEHYARIVASDARRRSIIRAAASLRDAAYNGGLDAHPEAIRKIRQIIDEQPTGASAHALDLDQLLAGPVPETDWLWNGWIAWEDICLMVGEPKTGKSLLALGLANVARTGGSFLGEPVSRARVGIFDLENPLGEVHKRLRRIGLTADDHRNVTYIHQPHMNLSTIDGVSTLNATIEEHDMDVVIIDSFRRAAPGIDENDSAAVSAFFAPLHRIIAGRRRIIIVVHHARKRQGGDQDQDAAQMTRGSGDFLAAVDSQIYLRRKEAGVFTLEHGASRRGIGHESISVRVTPADDDSLTFTNEGPAVIAETKMETLLVKIVETLREAGGGPITSTVLKLKIGVSPKEQRSFYNALNLGHEKGWLAKTEGTSARDPAQWALTEETW